MQGTTTGIRAGARARVRVPGSSANLGPGFDCLGLALSLYDSVEVEVLETVAGSCAGDRPTSEMVAPSVEVAVPSVEVIVQGAGAGDVALDESHLVVRALRAGLAAAGAGQPSLRVTCVNAIPHGRGIGSSAAAIVSGVLVARGLLEDPQTLDDDLVLDVATRFEGHPDNAAASLFGSLVLGWMSPRSPATEVIEPPEQAESPEQTGSTGHKESIGQKESIEQAGSIEDGAIKARSIETGSSLQARALVLAPSPEVRAVICIPDSELSTAKARAMLPAEVPHADAAFVAARAALLVEAITRRPDLLFDATEDRLHQQYRADAMPATATFLAACRKHGLAATVSGAGPSVLVLGTGADLRERVAQVAESTCPNGWQVMAPGIDRAGALLEVVQPSGTPNKHE